MTYESDNQPNYLSHPLVTGADDIFTEAALAGQEAEDAAHAEQTALRGELTPSQFAELKILAEAAVPVANLHLPEEEWDTQLHISVDNARDLMTLVRLGYAGIQPREDVTESTVFITDKGKAKLSGAPYSRLSGV